MTQWHECFVVYDDSVTALREVSGGPPFHVMGLLTSKGQSTFYWVTYILVSSTYFLFCISYEWHVHEMHNKIQHQKTVLSTSSLVLTLSDVSNNSVAISSPSVLASCSSSDSSSCIRRRRLNLFYKKFIKNITTTYYHFKKKSHTLY
jgi:hypothetical protein